MMKFAEVWRVAGGLVLAAGVEGRGWGQATEGTTPVAVGVVRVDADVWGRGEDWELAAGAGGRGRSEVRGGMQVATGLAEQVEVLAGGAIYRREEVDGGRVEGAGDVVLGARWRVAGDEAEGAAWAVLPYVKLPTAGARFADDTVDAGVLVVFGRPWGEAGYLNAQVGWDDYGDGAGGRDAGASGAAVVGRSVGARWSVFAETTAGLYPKSGDSDALAVAAGGGVTWAGNDAGTWGLDVAGYAGVTRAATDAQGVLRFWVELGGGR